MQATVSTGASYGVRGEGRSPAVRVPPNSELEFGEVRELGEPHLGSDQEARSGSPVDPEAALGWSSGLRFVREFSWTTAASGFLACAAVLSMLQSDGVAGWSVGCGTLSLGTALLAWRQAQAQWAREQAHWAGQWGRVLQNMGRFDDRVVVLDRMRRVQWASPGFCRSTRKTLRELLGRPVLPQEWVDARMEEPGKRMDVICASGGWRGESVTRGKDGASHLAEQWVFGVRGLDGGMSHYLGIRRDAHAPGHSLEELTRANEAMEARLLQVTSEFGQFKRELEMMSFALGHQLRSAQIGLTEAKVALGMERPEVIPANVRREVEWMMRSGSRMMRLIECLGWLHELKGKPLELERIDLSAMATEILDGFSDVEPGRSIRISVEPRLWAVGDARLLRVMLGNLLGNAWKFSRTHPNARIEFGAAPDASARKSYFVRDNGAGLDRSWVSRVLQGDDVSGYLEASSDHRLGLVVVQRIVERHRGAIRAESPSGGGVEFRFNLG